MYLILNPNLVQVTSTPKAGPSSSARCQKSHVVPIVPDTVAGASSSNAQIIDPNIIDNIIIDPNIIDLTQDSE